MIGNRTPLLSFFPRVMITLGARQKLQYFVDLCPEEISGLGTVEKQGNNFLITDVFLFQQVVTNASTDLDQRNIGKLITNLIREGKDPSKIKLWWHSHADMEPFWSMIDESTIAGLENAFMISVVGSKSGEFRCRIDLYSPFRMTVIDLPLIIIFPENPQLKEKCLTEIKIKVKKIVPKFIFGRQEKEVTTEDEIIDIGSPFGEEEEKKID